MGHLFQQLCVPLGQQPEAVPGSGQLSPLVADMPLELLDVPGAFLVLCTCRRREEGGSTNTLSNVGEILCGDIKFPLCHSYTTHQAIIHLHVHVHTCIHNKITAATPTLHGLTCLHDPGQ